MNKYQLMLVRGTVALSVLLSLSGCGVSNLWSAKPVNAPSDLVDVENRLNIQTLWSTDLGAGTDGRHLHLVPAIDGGRIFAADGEGNVQAIDRASGNTLWSVETGEPITGGPGVGDGLVLIGTGEAEVIALDQNTGTQLWRTRVSSEVLSAPTAALGTVVVHALDGKVIALNAASGEQRWVYERKIPTLTLRGSSSPIISGTLVISGLSGGRLVALELENGEVVWSNVITVPSGRSQLERLTDIDGDPVVAGNAVFAATYQGDVAAVGEFTGTLLWKRELSVYASMAIDSQLLYVGDDQGVVWGLDAMSGSAAWKQEDLKHRKLSAVARIPNAVVVGDYQGYLHFLEPSSGAMLARVKVGGGAISSGVRVADGILYVQNDDGTLEALRVVGQ